MAPERRRQILLGALALAIAAIATYGWWPAPPGTVTSASNGGPALAGGAAPSTAPATAPKVALEALAAERPKPAGGERNLFRFKPPPAPPPPPPAKGPAISGSGPDDMPAQAAQPAPITLRFIGIVEAPEHGQKFAVLTDGRNVWYGKEGEIVLGQYRILRIGAESIEIAYADGRGRRAIRLTGP